MWKESCVSPKTLHMDQEGSRTKSKLGNTLKSQCSPWSAGKKNVEPQISDLRYSAEMTQNSHMRLTPPTPIQAIDVEARMQSLTRVSHLIANALVTTTLIRIANAIPPHAAT